MGVPFMNLKAMHEPIKKEINKAISNVVDNCSFILGEDVEKFEEEFAKYIGVKYCVGLASGLDSLKVALLSQGIGSGDEVILPANTFIATALAVSQVGAKPVFVDCKQNTYEISSSLVSGHITEKTKAIIPVHLYAQSANMTKILSIAEINDLAVIEDTAQAAGIEYMGQKCGSMGDVGCFSFYPGKLLGGFGDSGCITTNSKEVYNFAKKYRNYGQEEKYCHVIKGANCRMDSIQAAVLRIKLKYLDEWNSKRVKLSEYYRLLLSDSKKIALQEKASDSTFIPHLMIARVDSEEIRDALVKYLNENGIQTGLHYPTIIPQQDAYIECRTEKYTVAKDLASRCFTLPMCPTLTEKDISYVCKQINIFFDKD